MFRDLIELVELKNKEEGGPTHILKIPVRLVPDESENKETDEAPMSDAQRRFIFRLLADKGVEGEEAVVKYLKENYKVKDLKKLCKKRASEIIEDLKGGENA